MVLGVSQFDLHQVVGSLRTVNVRGGEMAPPMAWPFVTVSRQTGAGGTQFGHLLAERLNRLEHWRQNLRSTEYPQEPDHPWQCLDRELVERIAQDHHLSADLIDSLERSSHTWVEEFFRGLSRRDTEIPSEMTIVKRVAETMRALAQAGHVILVGLGGVFMTRDMRAGIHIRVVAPFDYRVQNLAKLRGISEREARKVVETMDHDRAAFFHQYWPTTTLSSELFHLTLNASLLGEEQMVDSVLPLVKPLIRAEG